MRSTLQSSAFEDDISTNPEAALELLAAACRNLEHLAKLTIVRDTRHYHRSVSIVHDICEALTNCEAAGVPDEQIRAVITPAREIHAASPFVTRLQQWPRGYPGDFETIEWLWRGPPAAHVTDVQAIEVALEEIGGAPPDFAGR